MGDRAARTYSEGRLRANHAQTPTRVSSWTWVKGSNFSQDPVRPGLENRASSFRARLDMTSRSAFVTALCSDGPAPDRAEKLNLYGWLIGSWEMEATVF